MGKNRKSVTPMNNHGHTDGDCGYRRIPVFDPEGCKHDGEMPTRQVHNTSETSRRSLDSLFGGKL